MKKLILVLVILVLVCVPGAQAGPLDWAKHHKRFLIMEGAAATGSVIHARGLKRCRVGDVERCDEGYGSAWAWYWTMTTWSTVVSPAIAEACWKGTDDWKGCYFFAYNGAAYQTAQGIYDFRNYKPKGIEDTCHDMRCEDSRFRVKF